VKELIFTPISCCSANGNRDEIRNLGSSSSVSDCGCDARQQKKRESFWNCDGELLRRAQIRVTIHTNLVRIIARSPVEIEDPMPQTPDLTPPNMEPLPTEIPIN